MGLLEQQNFLAKLYTDDNFREKFISEPEEFGKKHKLNVNEIDEISEILPDEIIAFADSLFYKRLREVERFLPWTRKELGAKFEREFREFIIGFNPQSVKKHLEDAIEFAKFLQLRKLNPTWLKDIIKLEQSKLEFAGFGKRLIIKKFDFDVRDFYPTNNETKQELNKRNTFAIWLRFGKTHKHFII